MTRVKIRDRHYMVRYYINGDASYFYHTCFDAETYAAALKLARTWMLMPEQCFRDVTHVAICCGEVFNPECAFVSRADLAVA